MNFQQSYLYWLAGAVLLIVALMSWQDKANPRRFTTGLFWGIYGVLFLLGDWTYSLFGDKRTVHIAVGVAVVVLALIAGFGGVKLGTGGLIRAYGGGASNVLNHCTVIKKQFSDQLQVVVSYASYGGLSNGLMEREVIPVNEDFGENVTLFFQIPVAETNGFLAWIEDKTNGTAQIIRSEPAFVDVVFTL